MRGRGVLIFVTKPKGGVGGTATKKKLGNEKIVRKHSANISAAGESLLVENWAVDLIAAA
jgi:hypothetical protein